MARHWPLIWAAPALDDLDELASWIALDNPAAAARLVGRILDLLERLSRHHSGRRVPQLRGKLYREVIVPPCRVIYRREGGAILIVHVLRSQRRLRAGELV
jgi:plasmid stabilization system protein ParE